MKINQDTEFTSNTIVGSGGVLYALANKTSKTNADGKVSYEADLVKIDKVEDAESAVKEFKTQYIRDTGWIWEKYNRNVLLLKTMTDEEFKTKYSDIIAKQEECRLAI